MKKIVLIVLPLLLGRCALFEKSVGLGVSLGAVTGVTASQLVHYNTKGTVVLGLSGALLGGAIGALLHQSSAAEPQEPPPAFSVLKNNPPPLKNAEKDVLWIPDRIEGDRFEEGHRVFVIKKPAHWQLHPANPDEEGGETNE